MNWGVITFPGSNDDVQAAYALETLLGESVVRLWHKDTALDGLDCVLLPGGFSYGDYLRCGAMARFSPIMRAVADFAAAGRVVIGICNGFQILCEAGLLPGALIRNRGLSFLCTRVHLRVDDADTLFTNRCRRGDVLDIPIKHGDGCYVADGATLRTLEAQRQIVLRYSDADGRVTPEANPNGSLASIAGVDTPVVHAPAKEGEQLRSVLDGSRLRKLADLPERKPLSEGLKETFDWFRTERTR